MMNKRLNRIYSKLCKMTDIKEIKEVLASLPLEEQIALGVKAFITKETKKGIK